MKTLSYLSILFASTLVWAHGNESRIEIELESPATIQAGQSELAFQVVDTELNRALSDQDLKIAHEKKLHVLIYDQALKEFTHVHPEYINGLWKVSINLAVDGKYFLWAQGELASDSEEFSALSEIKVSNGSPAWPLPPTLTELRTGTEGASKVTLGNQTLRAGKAAMLDLKFTRTDGTSAVITPYLGALAHVVATPADGDSLIHVHPMNGNQPNEGMLHVTFPNKGNYRLWIQFMDGGILRTIPLVVKVL